MQTNALISLFAIVFMILFGMRGCMVSATKAISAMEEQGFSEVEILDHSYLFVGLQGCDSKDSAAFDVRAKNTNGKTVNMVVCSGWPFKGATIRSK